jgi:hypothetical protein
MKAIIVIIFLINGQPEMIMDGYAPEEIDAIYCADGVEFTKTYLGLIANLPPVLGVFCGAPDEVRNEINIQLFSEPV